MFPVRPHLPITGYEFMDGKGEDSGCGIRCIPPFRKKLSRDSVHRGCTPLMVEQRLLCTPDWLYHSSHHSVNEISWGLDKGEWLAIGRVDTLAYVHVDLHINVVNVQC